MNKFKGTKGEWEIDGEHLVTVNESGESLETIADFYPGTIYDTVSDRSFEETEANILLCSKAPEMLEKLTEVRKWYEENQSRLGDYTPVIFSEINDLIKKATKYKMTY